MRGSPYAQNSGLPFLESACSRTERVDLREKLAAVPEQVFTFRGQLDAAADVIEQRHAEIGLQRMDLPRGSRLA